MDLPVAGKRVRGSNNCIANRKIGIERMKSGIQMKKVGEKCLEV